MFCPWCQQAEVTDCVSVSIWDVLRQNGNELLTYRKIKNPFKLASVTRFSARVSPWVGKVGSCNSIGVQGGLTEGQRQDLDVYNLFADGPLDPKGNIQ